MSLLGLLEYLFSLLNLYLAGRNINARQDGFLRTHSFLEFLQLIRPPHNSLGKHPALLGQPLLINDMEDCNDLCKYS
jgi:hypothetical protein